jgi:peptidoglycan/LPS O-acetylase OafA/YrhL
VNVRATRFPLFDSLRAIAALAIVGTHAAVFAGVYDHDTLLRPYAARLEAGVAVFFVISGFLLYRPFIRARLEGTHSPRTAAYAWRRFLRIAPAYWVALTAIAIWLGTPDVFTAAGIPTFYALGQGYRESAIGGGLTQAWSLTIEVAFYVFLPLYAWLVARLAGRRGLRAEVTGVLVLVAVSGLWKAAALAGGDPDKVLITPQLIALPGYLDQFALGMGLAVLSVWLERRDKDELPRVLRPLDRFPSIAWATAALAFWAVSTQVGLTGRFFEDMPADSYIARHYLFGLIGLGLVLPAVVGDQTRGIVRRALALRPLLWLGLVSYGIFLWNIAGLVWLDGRGLGGTAVLGSFLGWFVLGAAVSALLGALSYYVVERPALSLKRLIPEREDVARGEAIAEPAPVTALAPPAG